MEKIVPPVFKEENDNSGQKIETVLAYIENRGDQFKNLLKETFEENAWLKVFLEDNHHGYIHGDQVRVAGLKLVANLNSDEKEKLLQEGMGISKINSDKYATAAIEIAAIFHDCGRFNEAGEVISEEQNYHHILSAKRAAVFCREIGLGIIVPDVEEAILCHDFQSHELTPDLNSPQTIIGKIVQSADQMGWFHPDSVNRTLAYNKALGAPFYNSEVTLNERLSWKPGNKSRDALTVMLKQLFGPTNAERFGIEFARNKVEMYKIDLENNILKIADEYNLKTEVEILIEKFKNI